MKGRVSSSIVKNSRMKLIFEIESATALLISQIVLLPLMVLKEINYFAFIN
jgi:hypothetical protein